MRFDSILLKVLFPLLLIVGFLMFLTLRVTEDFLKQTVENVYIKSEIENLKSTINGKIDNKLMQIIRDSMVVASCPDTAEYLKSSHAKEGNLTKQMQEKFLYFKNFYNLESVYATEVQTRNYYNETGFVKVVDPQDPESFWFEQTLQNKAPYTVNVDSFLTGELTIWVDVVVREGKEKIGLAGGGIKIANILEPLKSILHTIDADAILVDRSGMIRAATDTKITINNSLQEQFAAEQNTKYETLQNMITSKQEFVSYTSKERGHRRLLAIPVTSLDWLIVIDFSDDVFLAPVEGVLNKIFTGGIVILFTILLLVWLAFSFMVARPLKNLSRALEQYDYDSNLQLQGCGKMGYEIDTICKSFQKSAVLLRKTLQNYRESEELLRNVTNATDDLLFYKNKEKKYIGFNRAYEKWTGKQRGELLGCNDYDLYPKEIAEHHDKTDTLVLHTKKPVMIEEELKNARGERFVLHINKSPLWDNDGKINGIVGVARDITHIKTLEKELRELNSTLEMKVTEKTHELQVSIVNLRQTNHALKEAKQKALHAAQARSNFISSVSHELRTPMNAIINFTDQILEDFDEIMEDEALQKESRYFLERVLVNAKHLLHLINELLEFTKAESGKIEYDIQKHDINEIIRSAYTNTYSLLVNTQIKYSLACQEGVLYAQVDARRLLQVLLNLLSNAIKFTKQGSIEIRSFAQEGQIVIEVEDTGRGIAEEKMGIIFDPFIQANRDDAGTGLGLGLAKRMCEDMGIALSVRSQENVGTVFALHIKSIG
jgi:PAS domain S-box-containing protein